MLTSWALSPQFRPATVAFGSDSMRFSGPICKDDKDLRRKSQALCSGRETAHILQLLNLFTWFCDTKNWEE